MKKKAKAVAEQPIGIVIATGSVALSTPRVKAYLWCEADMSEVSRSEEGSPLAK